MARRRVTAVFTDEGQLDDLPEIVERHGHVVVVECEYERVDALTQAGLFILQDAPAPSEPQSEDLGAVSYSLPAVGAEQAAVTPPGLPHADPAPGDVFVAHLKAPLLPIHVATLTANGFHLLERLKRDTFAIRTPEGDGSPLQALGFVHAVRRAEVEETLDPALTVPVEPAPSEAVTFEALVHDPEDLDLVHLWLVNRSVLVVATARRKVRFLSKRDDPLLVQLGQLPQVRTIDEYVRPTLTNDTARITIGVDSANGSQIVPWTGGGQIVGVADSGIDSAHPDFANRIVATFAHGRPGDTSDPNGHGTHVAGSIAGAGETVRGVAPDSRLVVQSLLRANGEVEFPVDLGTLLDESYDAGARIQNLSWAAQARSAYRILSFELDEWAWEHQDMLIVVSAGNRAVATGTQQKGFVDLFSVDAPGTAKNALTVGASRTARSDPRQRTWRNYDPARFADAPIADEAIAGQSGSIAAFSGRGPCDEENRFKPDIVAPGTYILSTRSATAPDTAYWDVDPGQPYAYLGGTSMAAPLVAGAAAVAREYYVSERSHSDPSAALLKATLVNGARWLTGADAIADHPTEPNYHQGFGCVDIGQSLPVPGHDGSPAVLEFVDNWKSPAEQLTTLGQARRWLFRADAGRLRLCLAWPDPPPRSVQNVITFTVTLQGQSWIGNEGRPKGVVKRLDTSNNVQVVRIDDAPAGIYLVQITAGEILQPPQPFALVITGNLTSALKRQP
ncbi:MAG: S8 family serine peptidase [Chloroflexi bacterium]|nr:S8 family serine peptidase [Chloroflexota bacterium]